MHIIVKALNIQKKEKILKSPRVKHHVTGKGKHIRKKKKKKKNRFLNRNSKTRRAWDDVFQVPKENNCQF
jgi:hypothetical protein